MSRVAPDERNRALVAPAADDASNLSAKIRKAGRRFLEGVWLKVQVNGFPSIWRA